MPRINIAQFRKEIIETAGGQLNKAAFEFAREEFAERKEELIKAFENHPVTQELRLGPESPDLSGATNGRGNLYSFIGFHDDEDEAEQHLKSIETILEYDIILLNTPQVTTTGNKLRWQFGIFLPAESELEAVTPMPWGTSQSWLEGLERKGISGLNFYLYRAFMEASRSTTGLQTRKPISNVIFRRTDYIFKLLDDFKGLFK